MPTCEDSCGGIINTNSPTLFEVFPPVEISGEKNSAPCEGRRSAVAASSRHLRGPAPIRNEEFHPSIFSIPQMVPISVYIYIYIQMYCVYIYNILYLYIYIYCIYIYTVYIYILYIYILYIYIYIRTKACLGLCF